MTSVKEKFERLYQDMAKFKRTHRAAMCSYCECEIEPGRPIYVHDDDIYCSPECACAGTCIEKLDFQMDGVYDDGYRSFFDRKENDDDDDT